MITIRKIDLATGVSNIISINTVNAGTTNLSAKKIQVDTENNVLYILDPAQNSFSVLGVGIANGNRFEIPQGQVGENAALGAELDVRSLVLDKKNNRFLLIKDKLAEDSVGSGVGGVVSLNLSNSEQTLLTQFENGTTKLFDVTAFAYSDSENAVYLAKCRPSMATKFR